MSHIRIFAVAALTLTGFACGGADGGVGVLPIAQPTDRQTVCLPIEPGHRFTVGLDALKNQSGQEVEIERASLIGASGLRLARSFVTPLDGRQMVGVYSTYPPQDAKDSAAGKNWQNRTELVGARVAPKHEVGAVVVLALGPSDQQGDVQGVRIGYRIVGTSLHYSFKSGTKLIVRDVCDVDTK